MSGAHEEEYLVGLVQELRKLPKETEWAEFKVNNYDPEEMGEYISALANSAALSGKSHAYLVWGIEDGTHAIVGTNFSPHTAKVHGEELENYLLRSLSPKINFHFYEVTVEEQPVVLLEIERASRHPVRFKIHEFVRVGSYKKKLKDFPEKERELWRIFDQTPFEEMVAKERVQDDEVLRLLDYPAYFDMMKLPLPESRQGIIKSLEDGELIQPADAGGWNITNLGAILFAKRLSDFRTLRRKAMRVIIYRGNDRIKSIKEELVDKGYANGFEGLVDYINNVLPSNEVIKTALRETVPMYPELAVRELVANALIHQDFFLKGAGPMVEIFDDRMEISNPGIPLVEVDRFLDSQPKSRNETLASLMRRVGICEERGSGIDKVVYQTEFYQLPAPMFIVTGESTLVILLAPRTLSKMDKNDRVRACYLHACLKYVNRDYLTNSSLRERFGITVKNSATASRFIREAVMMGVIVPFDPEAAPKMMKYVPWWAAPDRRNT